ncbi:MAG: hypothetical protein ACRD0U_21225 [Acidimicrobiales bacterium]
MAQVERAATQRAEQAADALERSVGRLCWQRIEPGRAVVMAIRRRRIVELPVSTAVAEVLRRRGLRTVLRSTAA